MGSKGTYTFQRSRIFNFFSTNLKGQIDPLNPLWCTRMITSVSFSFQLTCVFLSAKFNDMRSLATSSVYVRVCMPSNNSFSTRGSTQIVFCKLKNSIYMYINVL